MRNSPAVHDDALRERIRANLAGFEREPHAGPGLRAAAVALALVPGDDGRPCFVLTRRASRLRAHGGQWALPGGRLDQGESAEQAALRELAEEVGLGAAPGDILGRLDDYPTRSGFVITPVVVWGGARPAEAQPAGGGRGLSRAALRARPPGRAAGCARFPRATAR